MRIAISATGIDLADQVDPRFGRCSHFIIFDPETLQHEAVDNSNAAAGSGAGIAAAQAVVDKGVRAVLTGLGQIVCHARRVILKVLEEIWATLIRVAQERAMALSPPAC